MATAAAAGNWAVHETGSEWADGEGLFEELNGLHLTNVADGQAMADAMPGGGSDNW